jgi:ABC-type lipoprotein export system ATPase subunit
MVRFEGIVKEYRKRGAAVRALDGVDLTITAGSFVVVKGPSGCGKSTLLLAAGAAALLNTLGLGPRIHHRPAELSAGEKQRAALARALVNRPPLLLADEPTGNLDPQNARQVMEHLDAYRRAGGTVLLVTHGDDADPFATQQVRMANGRIVPA